MTFRINREPVTEPEKCAGGAGSIEMGPASMRYVPSTSKVASARTVGRELAVSTPNRQVEGVGHPQTAGLARLAAGRDGWAGPGFSVSAGRALPNGCTRAIWRRVEF